MLDSIIDSMNRNNDAVESNNDNALSPAYLHSAQCDPDANKKFTITRVNPDTSKVETVDITSKVLYLNAATGVMFAYNDGYKNDPKFGYGFRKPGWYAIAGATTK